MNAAVLSALVGLAAWHDLRTREVPDYIAALVFVWACGFTAWQGTAPSWLTLVGGAVLGFLLTAPLFYLGGIGGGDVKLITALGAALGPAQLLTVLFWVALAGGVLALFAKLRGAKDFAYVPAIFAGLVASFVCQYWSGVGG